MRKLTSYGKFIKKLRIDHDMQLKEHAESIGVSETFLCNIESGKKPISMDFINKTIKLFKMDSKLEEELIKAISECAPMTVKIKPKSELEALVSLEFSQALTNGHINQTKLKEFLKGL